MIPHRKYLGVYLSPQSGNLIGVPPAPTISPPAAGQPDITSGIE
jgi:hypothetical protein